MRRGVLLSVVTLTLLAVASPPAVMAVIINNPWIVNDRVADTHNLNTMAATYINAYTPNGVVAPANNQDKAINIYNNQKRRLYHWADEPPSVGGNDINDPTYNQNVFGWGLCGRHACMGCTIAKAVGFGQRKIAVPGDWQMEFIYDGGNHLFHSMTTFYVFTRGATPHIAGCDEIVADNNLVLNAVAEGRACPGFLLCGDTAAWEADAVNHYSDGGDASVTTRWTGNMNIRTGEVFHRGWDSWLNEHPPIGGGGTPPYHHEASHDNQDYINYPYWEPYRLTSAQSTAINISYTPTFRRWANGTDTVTPNFRTADYQDLLYSSTNISTYYQDSITPDLHANALGTLSEAVFQVQIPYYLTDGTISGTFKRTNAGDITRILTSPDGSSWTQVWDNTATGNTVLTNLSLRNQVFGNWNQFFIKVQIQAASNKADAGVTGLTFNITYEHNKGAMAYLDKGVNHLTYTCDNPSALGSGYRIKLDYKWKEYDGSDWTIDKAYTKYISASPTNITLTTGGTKVPRTEYIEMTIVPTPPADTTAPAAVSNLACGTASRTSMPLTWTAPGNDGSTGEATGYDLRYSTSAITAGNFSAATQVANVPVPRPVGGAESFTVTGLTPSTTYYFAIKAYDDAGNYGTISNVPSAATMALDNQAPNAVSNLAVTATATLGAMNVTWTAPADNGNGYVASYDLRWSTSAITAGNFSSATQLSGLGAPKSAGQSESFTTSGLPTGVTVYFAIKSADDSGNWSAISNLPSVKQSIGTITFQNGLNGYAGAQDTYMDASAVTTKYDGTTYLQIAGMGGGANRRRPIVKFDLTSIPAGGVITQATLYLYAYSNEAHDATGGYYGAYHVFTPWSAPNVSWNMPWVQYGGSDIDTLDGQTAKQTTTGVWYAIDVTSRTQRYISGLDSNNGWTIKPTSDALLNQDWFYACEYATDATLRPKLVVTDTGLIVATACSPSNAGSVTGGGTYQSGQQCTLTATATGQFVFNHWSGAPIDGSTTNPATFTVNSGASITAVFTSTDTTAPAAVANLAAAAGSTSGTVNLTWTAPGDDGSTGTAYAYDVRYSTSAITAGNFASATQIPGIGAPKAAGQSEAYTVNGLTNGTLYYFALKTRDEVPNWSGLSNVVSATPMLGDQVFQNGLNSYAGCNDSYMNAGSATTNYGTNTRMTVCGYADQGATNVQRGLVKFDLSSIPTSTTITRATLYLYSYQVAGSSGAYGAYPLTRAFTDTGVTWNTFDGTNAWTTAGGDFNATADGTAAKQGVANVWYSFDVTSRAQNWITNPANNTGWVIKCTDENLHNQDLFYASDYTTDATLRPKLIVSTTAGFAVTTACSPTTGGTVSGGGNYSSGGSCTLTASPDTNYGFTFVRWSGGPVDNQTANPVTFTVTADTTVTAVFQEPANYIDVGNYAELKTAIQTTAVAGNTIRVHPGTYTMPVGQASLPLNNHGNAGNPITVIGVGGSKPIMTTTGQNIDRGFFFVNPADSNWTFDNLEFQNIYDAVNANAAAAYIQAPNVTFQNCKIHNCDEGFSSALTATNTLIQYTEIYNCNSSVNPGFAHLMYMNSDSLTVRGCYLHDALHGQLFKSRSNNTTLEYCWLENEGPESLTAGLASGNANNTLIRGNVFIKRSTGSTQAGVLYLSDGGSTLSGTVTLINNTFYSGSASDAYIYHNTGSTANVVLKNNIFAGPSDTLFSWNAGIPYSQLSGTNNVFKPNMNPVPTQLVNNSYPASPGFVNAGTHDFHLLSNSACVNIGQNGPTYLNYSGVATDGTPAYEPTKTLVLDTRVSDGQLDCGAYEYHSTTPAVQFSQTSSSGSESTTSVNIPVTLSYSYSGTVTVQYAVTGGTASGGGVDYTLAAGQLTFTTGVTSQNIPLTIVNDSLNETNETIVITLSSPTNATLGANTTHTYTINDDDAAPTVQFAATSSSGSESATSVNLAVNLSAASGQTVTVQYAATGGTATGGGVDYTLNSGTLTFNPGVTSQNVSITVVDDALAEPNETIVVTLSSPTNATLGANTTCTYTINDNDSAPTVQFTSPSGSGAESVTSVNIPVSLSAASGQAVTVNYAVTGGTAVQGTDFTISGTSLTFSPGITSQNIPITIINDNIYGPNDTIVLTLSGPGNATLGTNTTYTYTILDTDDPAPTVQFSSASGSGSESVTSVNIPVTLSAVSEYTTTVQYAVTGGTATGGGVDYTLTSGVLTFNPGVTSQNIAMTVADDALNEANETVIVTLTSPAYATLGTNTTYTYTINDNDPAPAVQFTSATGSGSESVTSVNIPVSLGAASGQTVTVNYAVTGGTATGGGVDYTLTSGTLTFAPGVTSQNISMTVVDDSLVESNETVIVTLSSPSNATLGTNTTYTYTIIDNDVAAVTVQFQTTAASGSESVTPANLTVTLSQASAQTVTVKYNVTGGTATQGADYTLPTGPTGGIYALKRSAGLTDTSRLDNRFVTAIGNSTIVVNTGQDMAADTDFWSNTGWAQSNCYGNYGGAPGIQFGATFFLSKFKTSSLPGFSGSTINKAEVRYYYTGGNTGLSNASYVTSSDWIEGTGTTDGFFPGAAGGASFAHPNGHNTAANQDTNGGTTGPMQTWANNDYFGLAKDVSALVIAPGAHNAGADFVVYDVTQIVQLWANGTPNYGFCVWDTAWNFGIQYSETAAGATYQPTLFIDYTATSVSDTVTFAPGETSKVIPITIINDSTPESNETIQVTLSNPTNATLGANTVETYTILDDDTVIPTVQFSAASSNGSEATTSVTIPVTLSASTSQTVTVNYAVTGGTATGGGVDYTLASGTLTFNPTVTSQNIAVTVNNDALDEPNETIVITLSSPTNATLGTTITHTYTINDDDPTPTVAFSSASGSGAESITSVTIPVTLSAASGQTVTVNYAVTGGTATGGGVDYTLNSGTLTFTAGTTTQNISMTVVDDATAESNETVIVTLSSPSNATLGTNTTYTYTINDNDTAPTFVAAGAVASGTGAITPALPSGLQANDILLLFVETANQTISITNQNGGTWTQVTGSPQGTGTAGGTAATCLTAFWSRYNGTQGAPTTSDSGDHQLARIVAIRGATTSGNPWNVTAGAVDATSNTSGSIPGATTTVANTLVVVAIATSLPDASSTANFSGWTNAALSSLTERTDNAVTAGNGGGLGIATGGKATAGAYGATAVTLANAAQKGMMSIAIRP